MVFGQNSSTTELPDIDFSDADVQPSGVDVGTAILASILNSEAVQEKLQRIYNLIDLKVRFIKLVATLLTRENFVLLRRFLDIVQHVANFFIAYLPEDPPTGSGGFIDSLLPSLAPLPPDTATGSATSAKPISSNEVDRINRSVELTPEEKLLLNEHKDDVLQVAKLIYKTN